MDHPPNHDPDAGRRQLGLLIARGVALAGTAMAMGLVMLRSAGAGGPAADGAFGAAMVPVAVLLGLVALACGLMLSPSGRRRSAAGRGPSEPTDGRHAVDVAGSRRRSNDEAAAEEGGEEPWWAVMVARAEQSVFASETPPKPLLIKLPEEEPVGVSPRRWGPEPLVDTHKDRPRWRTSR